MSRYAELGELMDIEPEFLEQLRKNCPDVTEREAWLFDRLVGAAGMIAMLNKRRGATWHIGPLNAGATGFELISAFALEHYGLEVSWRKPGRGTPE